MKEHLSTVTSKGQVTIPIEIRRQLGLERGAKIAFVVNDAGEILVRPPMYPTIASLSGAAGTLPRPMSWEEMKAIIRDERAAAVTTAQP